MSLFTSKAYEEAQSKMQEISERWAPILDHEDLPPIKDEHRRRVTALCLENTQAYLDEAAPTNNTSGIQNYDPVMISLVRRSVPNLIAYDICGVQPMSGPTGLVFALRPRYGAQNGTEAFKDEANTAWSAKNKAGSTANTGSHSGTDPVADLANVATNYTVGIGMETILAEALGDDTSNNVIQEMSLSIEKFTVEAVSRKLRASYTIENAQDMRAIHGLDLEAELANILSTEIVAEINREVIRSIYRSATIGAQADTTTAGVFDLDTDSNGRWLEERFKGLLFQVGRDANQISKSTRMGKGNFIIVSSDVAEAFAMTGRLTYNPDLKSNLQVDDTGATFAGTLNNGMKVYIDPYFSSAAGNELVCVGYKGDSNLKAGLFYCPYVPLQMMRTVGEHTFQPNIAFQTRYAMAANPFATTNADGVVGHSGTAGNVNTFYRIFAVTNLI